VNWLRLPDGDLLAPDGDRWHFLRNVLGDKGVWRVIASESATPLARKQQSQQRRKAREQAKAAK